MFDIAIIGVGATAISLLKQIQDEVISQTIPAPRLALFSPADEFARGRAFVDADAHHKVNTPPGMLSISESEPDGFSRWLEKKGVRNKYPERVLYSQYLLETYRQLSNSNKMAIAEIKEEAVSVKRDGTSYRITGRNGTSVRAQRVVLCLGSVHGSSFGALEDDPGFLNHRSQYRDIKSSRILVAGTGLSAIDAFRTLSRTNTGEIHLFSRHGHPPTCLSSASSHVPTALTWENLTSEGRRGIRLQRFFELLNSECDRLPGGGEKRVALRILKEEGLARYFTYLTERALSGNLPYQDTLVSTRPYMSKVWQSMPMEDKLSFMINNGADWAAWRHPIPIEVMRELTLAAESGKLRVHRLSTPPTFKNGLFHIHTASGEFISSPYLVDGTGGTNRLATTRSELLRQLRDDQLIEEHPCGGININPLTLECRANGKATRRLYNLGPLSKGSLFSTNAFWFNAQCAGKWVRQWAIEHCGMVAQA
jgi:uncharacterized NAD(P)/FAD-binding protein YdhS